MEMRCKQAEQAEQDSLVAQEKETLMKQQIEDLKEKLKQTQNELKENNKPENKVVMSA